MSTLGPPTGPFWGLLFVVALVFGDWLLGILAALRLGTFNLVDLPRQLATTVLPYVGALAVAWGLQWFAQNVALPGTAAAGAATLFSYFADATVVPKTLADIFAKLGVIGTGAGATNAAPRLAPAAPPAGATPPLAPPSG